ncbi:hypothetical protein JHK87_032044 [Glycine soja]|nr:hypothetical protein JHK87_032044 [Glycine soja]
MRKNTMMKCMHAIRIHSENTGNKAFLNLIPLLVVGAPARVGLVAAIDVVVPPGNTGLDSSQTSFFQAATDSGTAPEAATKEEEKKEEPAEESNDHMGFSLDFMDSSLSV